MQHVLAFLGANLHFLQKSKKKKCVFFWYLIIEVKILIQKSIVVCKMPKFMFFGHKKTWLFSVVERHVFWYFTDHYSLSDPTFSPNNQIPEKITFFLCTFLQKNVNWLLKTRKRVAFSFFFLPCTNYLTNKNWCYTFENPLELI